MSVEGHSLEIRDYVRLHRRHLIRLLFIPTIVGVAAFVLILVQPQEFVATVEITVVPPDERTLSASDLGQYEANFVQILESETVRTDVARAAGLPLSDVDGLSAHQLGRSSRIEVEYSHRKEASANAGVVAAARAGVTLLAAPFEEAVADAGNVLAEATQRRDGALAAVDAFTVETGLVLPEDQFQSAASQMRSLEDEARQAAGVGNFIRAGILEELVAQRRQELDALGGQVLRFQGLENEVRLAEGPVQEAEAALEGAEARRDRVVSRLDSLTPDVRPVSEIGRATTGAAVSAGVAALFVAGLFARVLVRSSDELYDRPDGYYAELEPRPTKALSPARQVTGGSGLPERRQAFERVWPR